VSGKMSKSWERQAKYRERKKIAKEALVSGNEGQTTGNFNEFLFRSNNSNWRTSN
jgi:hypothetical protein